MCVEPIKTKYGSSQCDGLPQARAALKAVLVRTDAFDYKLLSVDTLTLHLGATLGSTKKDRS